MPPINAGRIKQAPDECPAQPPETISSINAEISNTLASALLTSEEVLRSVRGSQPCPVGEQTAGGSERTLFGDAKEIRSFAYELQETLNQLRNLLS